MKKSQIIILSVAIALVGIIFAWWPATFSQKKITTIKTNDAMKTQTIQKLYEALSNKNHVAMSALYHPQASFTDGIFNVKGKKIEGMWHFMGTIAQDFSLKVNSIEEKGDHFEVKWESFYKLGENNIHNVLQTKIKFQNNQIIDQQDSFSFYRIASQTGGLKGRLLGWLPAAKEAIKGKMVAAFDKFLVQYPAYQ